MSSVPSSRLPHYPEDLARWLVQVQCAEGYRLCEQKPNRTYESFTSLDHNTSAADIVKICGDRLQDRNRSDGYFRIEAYDDPSIKFSWRLEVPDDWTTDTATADDPLVQMRWYLAFLTRENARLHEVLRVTQTGVLETFREVRRDHHDTIGMLRDNYKQTAEIELEALKVEKEAEAQANYVNAAQGFLSYLRGGGDKADQLKAELLAVLRADEVDRVRANPWWKTVETAKNVWTVVAALKNAPIADFNLSPESLSAVQEILGRVVGRSAA